MPDADRLKGYVDAVANIKDTAKWIIAALGAIFTVLLGGIQLNAFGFARPGGPSFWVWVALGVSLAAVAAALWLAGDVLVSEGVSLDDLIGEQRHADIRTYINSRYAHMYPGHQNVLCDLFALLQTQAAEVQAGTRPQNDADYQLTITRLTEAVYIAGWRLTLARFRRLRLAFIAIVPAVAGSVLIMVSHAEPAAAEAKALDSPVPLVLTVTSADYEVLRAAGLPTNCIGPALAVLLYRETSLGVSEAATFPTYSCPSRRIVILDRKRIIKAL